MFWKYLRGYQDRPKDMADLIPWAEAIDGSRVIRCKDQSLLAVWQLFPLDLSRLTPEAKGQLLLRFNSLWKRIPGGWCVWLDRIRRPAVLPPGAPQRAHAVPDLIDDDHRTTYDPTLWEEDIYLAPEQRAPKLDLRQTMTDVLYTGEAGLETDVDREQFEAGTRAIIDVLRGCVEAVEPLEGPTLGRYLHRLVSDHDQSVGWPPDGSGLDTAYYDADLVTGLRPTLGRNFIAEVSVRRFPDELWVGMLEELARLPFGYRMTVVWLPHASETNRKQLTRIQEQHSAKKYGAKDALLSWLMKEREHLSNSYAEHQEKDTDAAKLGLLTEEVSYGDWALTILLQDADERTVHAQADEVLRVLRSRALVPVKERLNVTEAFLGSWPGLPLKNPRKYRVSSMNGLHLSRLDAPWAGIPETRTLQAPALCLAKTSTCMPFWLTLFDDDVGHVRMFGPSGSGKTAMLTFFASCALSRYAGARLRTLDWKRAARAFYLCLGVPYRDFEKDRIALQPYASIDDAQQQAWAFEWTLDRLQEFGVVLTPVKREYVQRSLDVLASKPREDRTMSALRYIMGRLSAPRAGYGVTAEQMGQIRSEQADVTRAIDALTAKGSYGYLFDSGPGVEEHPVADVFELQGLAKTPRIVPAVVSCLAQRRTYTGDPTFLIIHEASRYLKFPSFVQQIDADLRLLRDKKWSLWLETQDVDDFLDSTLKRLLVNNCPTGLLLPNSSAMAPAIRPAYEAMGLAQPAIEQIAAATQKQDLYVQCPSGERLIHLPLSPVAKAICGASSPSDHVLMDRLLDEGGTEHFAERWLVAKGLPAAAQRLREIRDECTPLPARVLRLVGAGALAPSVSLATE